MARARKTVDLDKLVARINQILKESTCEPSIRQGMINVTEMALVQANAYRGFRYLLPGEVPAGHLPGIVPGVGRDVNGLKVPNNQYPDQTRIEFH